MKIFNQIPVINCVPTSCGINDKSFDDRILYFMPKIIDITNRIFGRLTAIRLDRKERYGNTYIHFWWCKCICGVEKAVRKQKLLNGETTSCGCYQREVATRDSTTHGLTGHPIWNLHKDIKNRCYNPKVDCFPDYGGRGVEMCDEWRHDFVSFYNWCIANGWQKGLQIDKDIKAKELGVDPLLYSPERCQFVTPKKNSNSRRNNRLIEFNGVTKTIMEWSELVGVNRGTINSRLSRGWSVERAFKIGRFNKYTKW